jgi:cytochrome c biogenesis protein CcdA
MQLDIRLPIGLMFTVLGLLLVVVGTFLHPNNQAVNVNLWWGAVMLIFGVVMFVLGRRGTATARLTEESPEGKKIEAMEAATGLEERPQA